MAMNVKEVFHLLGVNCSPLGHKRDVSTVERSYAESHAAAIKHMVIRLEKTIGIVKANVQLKAVTATKQIARDHAMPRMRVRISAGRLLSCQDNTAANTTKTEKKNPKALKKSQ